MKAVIYARYSSDNQREESIEGQIRECTAFAEKNGITILRHYIDRAFSAKTDNRPEFQNMIKDSGKRLFDMIIVWKLDRFARNRYDSARYKAALKKNGVKVVSATEVISDGAEGIILESVLEGYAEYYSADLSEKVVRGMTENALKSKYNGGTLPIGYQIDSDQCFQLDPLTAPCVREAFQRYDEGATMTQIRDWFNEQGVKNTRGQKMTYNSIQHLLNNRRYIGEYTYRDIVVPDGIPAIVPQDLFDRVQEKLAKNKKAPARHKAEDDYLLTTKLFCGYCGAYLCGESGTSHTGNVHHYYKCVSVKKKRTECHKKSVRKEWIEDLVVSETMKMVMDDTASEAIVSMLMDLQDRENVNLPLYEQQLREADTAIQNLLNAIQQGILTKSTKGRLEELEATKEELETKIACEKLAKPKVSAEFMTFWLHRFRKLDVRQKSHRKMLIDTFVNAIFLYDDKIVITFNYKDGTDTITFDDLKAALDKENTGSDLDCLTAPNLGTTYDTKTVIQIGWLFLYMARKPLKTLGFSAFRMPRQALRSPVFHSGVWAAKMAEKAAAGLHPFGNGQGCITHPRRGHFRKNQPSAKRFYFSAEGFFHLSNGQSVEAQRICIIQKLGLRGAQTVEQAFQPFYVVYTEFRGQRPCADLTMLSADKAEIVFQRLDRAKIVPVEVVCHVVARRSNFGKAVEHGADMVVDGLAVAVVLHCLIVTVAVALMQPIGVQQLLLIIVSHYDVLHSACFDVTHSLHTGSQKAS